MKPGAVAERPLLQLLQMPYAPGYFREDLGSAALIASGSVALTISIC